ncbi:ribonuclease P [Pedobacter glucosidilyticus]|uniref:Ribonuclease P protein component n=1 Tax=Pedobacter aquae TaxID=2605747 RepID=A0A5C0VL39_9SPHI|nr:MULTISPECIES: ribonuclease P protein component [Pedobacter]KHJ39701.1 ribonuclease P [Pedobacter glucosidilyticus]QEK51704.1 ribonuclease P protein component [Pedobacter aquae]
MKNFQLTKEERLCSKKLLTELFNNGSSFLFYPFRITWLINQTPQKYPAQIVISVPKRRFKKSVDRNLIKRRIKEAYRLQKATSLYPFLENQQKQVLVAFNYVGKEILDYQYLYEKLSLALLNLEKQMVK